MPELPEVETTRRGLAPHLIGHTVQHIEIRNRQMRWPIEDNVLDIKGQTIIDVSRRAKYLLLCSQAGTLILHLGMSGNTRICPHEAPIKKHDHFIVQLDHGLELRLHDPRRFGAVLWHPIHNGDINTHPRLKNLGPEPLGPQFTGDYLISSCRHRSTSIKQLVMNNAVVVGVGNIYASESLFRSGIHPSRATGRISAKRLKNLRSSIQQVLSEAISQGGTTLRDFLDQDGKPGYFKQKLDVYGREGAPCHRCSTPIKKVQISMRATYYCPHCQR